MAASNVSARKPSTWHLSTPKVMTIPRGRPTTWPLRAQKMVIRTLCCFVCVCFVHVFLCAFCMCCVFSPLAHAATGSLPLCLACSPFWQQGDAPQSVSIQRRSSHFLIWKPDAVSMHLQASRAHCGGKVRVLAPAPRLEQQALVPRLQYRTSHNKDFHACFGSTLQTVVSLSRNAPIIQVLAISVWLRVY